MGVHPLFVIPQGVVDFPDPIDMTHEVVVEAQDIDDLARQIDNGIFDLHVHHVGALQAGALKIGPLQIGPLQIGVGQVDIAQVGVAQNAVRQMGALEGCAFEVGIGQVRDLHHRPRLLADRRATTPVALREDHQRALAHARTVQLRVPRVGEMELHAIQNSSGEVRVGKVGPNKQTVREIGVAEAGVLQVGI